MESLCTSKPMKSVVECGMADLLGKVHDRRAVMMRLWPAQGSPAVAPEVSQPSWKSLCLGHKDMEVKRDRRAHGHAN
jgi:hypothetical protein